MSKYLIQSLSIDLVEEDNLNTPAKKIIATLHSFNYRFSDPLPMNEELSDIIYFWNNLFQIIIEYKLKDFLDSELHEILHVSLNNSLKEYPQILFQEQIINHLKSLKIDINKYLEDYYQNVDLSKLSEETICNELMELTCCYQQNLIGEKIFGIIFSRLPNYIRYSQRIFKILKNIFYEVKEYSLKRYFKTFLDDFFQSENLEIKQFNYHNTFYPAKCHPISGKFIKFLDCSKHFPTCIGDRKPLDASNFDRKRKNESFFFYNLEYGNKSINSVWRSQMIVLSKYFKYVSVHAFKAQQQRRLLAQGLKRKRDLGNQSLSIHKNCKFKPKVGKRLRKPLLDNN